MHMPTNIAFSGNVITVDMTDGSVQKYTSAPVVSDASVTVTHSDGSTEVFDKTA